MRILTEYAAFEDLLQVPTPIQNAMDENLFAHDLIDDSIRLEMNFPEAVHTDTLKLRWDMASIGCFSQALAGLSFEP